MNIAHILILNKLANIVLLNIHEKVSTVGRLPPMVLDKAQPAHKDRVEYNDLVMFFKQSFKRCISYIPKTLGSATILGIQSPELNQV